MTIDDEKRRAHKQTRIHMTAATAMRVALWSMRVARSQMKLKQRSGSATSQ